MDDTAAALGEAMQRHSSLATESDVSTGNWVDMHTVAHALEEVRVWDTTGETVRFWDAAGETVRVWACLAPFSVCLTLCTEWRTLSGDGERREHGQLGRHAHRCASA